MSLPFRLVGLGKNPELALEYAQLKNTNLPIQRVDEVVSISLPEGLTSSKLELVIWIAHMVPELRKHRELTTTESKSYQKMIDIYGEEETKKILYTYSNAQSHGQAFVGRRDS